MISNNFILIGAKPSDSPDQNPGGQLTSSISLTRYARSNGYNLHIIDTTQPNFPQPPLYKRLFRGINRIFELFSLLRKNDIKGVIIYVGERFSFFERIIMSMLCRKLKVPDLFFIRSGYFMTDTRNSVFFCFIARSLLKIPFKLGAQGTPWIDFYESLGVKKSRIVKICSWLPESSSITNKPKEVNANVPLHFIFIGWMVEGKGIHELLQAIEVLWPRYHFHFTFLGGGTLESNVRQQITKSGWNPDVKALGWVSNTKVQEFLESADVFVLPSYAEGFPNAMLEAMSKGLPSICSDVGGISESLQNGVNGFLIPPKKAQPLIDAMEQYLINPKLVTLHSKETLDIVKSNHNYETNCSLLFDVFN